jgi:hypothetical protein
MKFMRFSVHHRQYSAPCFEPARVVNLMSLNVKTKTFCGITFLPEINDGLTNQIIQWTG